MSEQEKNSRDAIDGEPSVVVVENQPSESKHKPYRPTDLPDESRDRHDKRPTAPAVPSLEEELKEVTHVISTGLVDAKSDENEQKTQQHVSTEISKHQATKMLSTSSHVSEVTKPPKSIVPAKLAAEPVLIESPVPIPGEIKPVKSAESVASAKKSKEESITQEIAELPTLETTKISDWSDEQEAGGLPRTSSRTSRVSRAVRQLFCCGVAYSPASEENINNTRCESSI